MRIARASYFTATGIAVVLCMPWQALAGAVPGYAPVPAWVKPVPLPAGASENSASPDGPRGVLLLRAVQYRFSDDGDTTYEETAAKALVDASHTSLPDISWNADTESVVIHKARILRGGKVIDLLENGQAVAVSALPSTRPGTLAPPPPTPYRVARFTPEDLKAGDILDVAYSVVHRSVMQGTLSEALLTDSESDAQSHYVRAVWPKSKPMQWQGDGAYATATLRHRTDEDELEYSATAMSRQGLPPIDGGGSAGALVFTEARSWAQIAAQAAPFYQRATAIAPSSPLQAEAEAVVRQTPDALQRLKAVAQRVREHVGFVRQETPRGDDLPASATDTWTARRGTAPSRAAVLLALLHGAGVTAEAVLVRPSYDLDLRTHLPQFGLLNGIYVRAEVSGQAYWIDPSRVDGPLLLPAPDYPVRDGLPVRAPAGDLTPVVRSPLAEPLSDTHIVIDASAGQDTPAGVHITTTLRGQQVRYSGIHVDGGLPVTVDGDIRRWFSQRYRWIDADRVAETYDAAAGELTLTLDGKGRLSWTVQKDDPRRILPLEGFQVQPSYFPQTETGATAPVRPAYDHLIEEVRLPDGGKGYAVSGAPVDKTILGVNYRRTATLKDGVATLELTARSVADTVAAADAKAGNAEAVALRSDAARIVSVADYTQSTADRQFAAAHAPTSAHGHIVRGLAYLEARESGPALDDFDAALKLVPDSPEALTGRAAARALSRDFDGAVADYQASLAIDPRQPGALAGLGAMLMERKDYDGALAAYARVLEILPAASRIHALRAGALAQKGLLPEALSEAQAELKADPRSALGHRAVVDIYIRMGKRDEAIAAARLGLAANPDDAWLHGQLAALLGCLSEIPGPCTRDEKAATEEVDRAIALHPTAYDYANRAQLRPSADKADRLADLDAALALEPQSVFALTTRAALYLSTKDYDLALADLAVVLAKAPGDLQAIHVRALVYEKQKRFDLSRADFETLLAGDPDNPQWLNSLCWSRATQGVELDKALDACNAAIRRRPIGNYYDSRGLVYLRLGRLDEAIADYDQALKLSPALAGSLYGRGNAKLRKGLTADGNTDIARAKAIRADVADEFAGYGVTP